jgi:hypothetical protein
VVRFDKHYVPWLNIASIRTTPGAALNLQNILVLACCAIACRHLPGGGPPGAQRGLQQLAEHAVLIRTFDAAAHASLEGVQALLILSMWSPAIGPASTSVHDGSLIASGAVRMALVLKLDQVSERAIALRTKAQDQGGFQEGEKKLYDDLMWKARLVSTYLERTRTRADGAVVAGGLQRRVEVSRNVCLRDEQWLMSTRRLTTGTQRRPTSMRSPFDHQVIDWRQFPGAGTALDARDFRLGISAQVFEATQRGLSKPFKDLDSFFTELDELLTIFNHARNVTQPIRCKSSSITSRRQQLTSSPPKSPSPMNVCTWTSSICISRAADC